MKVYIIHSNKTIEPFGEHPKDCLIANKPLRDIQKETLLAAGFDDPMFVFSGDQVKYDNEYILLIDSLYFSLEILEEFVAKSRELKTNTVCALKTGLTTLRTSVSLQEVRIRDDHVEYGLYYFPEKKDRVVAEAYPILIDPDKFSTFLTMPNHMCDSDKYMIPMTEKLIVQIDHWVNLWVTNILTILADGARLQKSSKIKLLMLALKSRSMNQWKVLKSLNKFGKNCDIHHTAYIEGSTLGDNVIVGAGSIIRESVIGNGVSIGNGVVLEESVIGDKSTILNGHFLYSVLYPNSFSVAEMVSASLIGKETFMGLNTTITDFRLDRRNVIVLKKGKRTDSGHRFLGACLGHGVHLGSGCIFAPGRAIPNELRIVPRKNVISNASSEKNMSEFRLIKI